MFNNLLGGRMTLIRANIGMTQTEFCEMYNSFVEHNKKYTMSMITLSSIESGRRMPSLDKLCKIAEFLKVSIDYLVGMDVIGNSKKEYHDGFHVEAGVMIRPEEYYAYDGTPVMIEEKFDILDVANSNPVWGILDVKNNCVVTADGNIPLTADKWLWTDANGIVEVLGEGKTLQLSADDLRKKSFVYVEPIGSDNYIKQIYAGMYMVADDGKNIIKTNGGYTLPIEGCGRSYAAYSLSTISSSSFAEG